MRESRESLSQQLKERRNSKCTKQISVQEQLLTLAKEDAKTKQVEMEHRRRLLDQFEASEKNFTNTMQLFFRKHIKNNDTRIHDDAVSAPGWVANATCTKSTQWATLCSSMAATKLPPK